MDTHTRNKLKHLDVDSNKITDQQTRRDVCLLLDGVEKFATENEQLKEHIQKLKDEINHLKGEQGKPNIRPQKKDGDISSENERNKKIKKPAKKKSKKNTVEVNKTQKCCINPSSLPDDAVFKGYDSVVIQDITIKPDNIKFEREVYYSPSLGKRFMAPLPLGYEGEYGPSIKSFILTLYNDSKITQPALHRLLNTVGIDISKATISRIITDGVSIFHSEKLSIVRAGIASTDYQHIDDTGARVNGKNHYTHVLCNPFYTAYFTRSSKDRLTVLKILAGGSLIFHLNEASLDLMKNMGLLKKHLSKVQKNNHEPKVLNEEEINAFIDSLFPEQSTHQLHRKKIKEACALVAYQNQDEAIKILLCDDAPQFKNLTEFLMLCWIHEARHYKKLTPFRKANQDKTDCVISQIWEFYHSLQDYQKAPNEKLSVELAKKFDSLFEQRTDYKELDARIQKTKNKKDRLLLVLKYPHLPLHNNSAELGARAQARKRDISLQTKNKKGTEAKDTMMTIVGTAEKLGVNVMDYIFDRVSKAFKMPALSEVIAQISQQRILDTG